MKSKASYARILLFTVFVFSSCAQQDDFPVLKGPYLGQKPPGMTPEIFAPGIISTGHEEFKAVFSPDGKELYYQLWGAPFPVILMMKEEKGVWTKPQVAPFSGHIIEGYDIYPDGTRMFIASHRPIDDLSKPSEKGHIWITEKVNNEWGELTHLRQSIFGYPTVASNGNLYLATGDIWISRFVDGHYTEMERLGNAINTEEFFEEDLFIAPDESYLLFCRRDDGFGSWDIFVSFRKKDGSWTKARNMGKPINSSVSDVYPFVTSDGKYLFFSSRRTNHPDYSEKPLTYAEKMKILNSPGNGNQAIYWVDAKIIEEMKPDYIK
jgi:hypothetical protein